jgi:CRISPR/Cas system-associated endonuclease Cas1
MERFIDRFYLHLISRKDLTPSDCKEKNLEVILEKEPTVDFVNFFIKK